MEENKNELKDFMESIPMKDYKYIKDDIVKECYITDDVWKNWLSGRTCVPPLAKHIINRIAKQEVFEIKGAEA